MAFNHVCSGFHVNMTEDQMERILTGLQAIVHDERLDIPMRRVYIEKSNGK